MKQQTGAPLELVRCSGERVTHLGMLEGVQDGVRTNRARGIQRGGQSALGSQRGLVSAGW